MKKKTILLIAPCDYGDGRGGLGRQRACWAKGQPEQCGFLCRLCKKGNEAQRGELKALK